MANEWFSCCEQAITLIVNGSNPVSECNGDFSTVTAV